MGCPYIFATEVDFVIFTLEIVYATLRGLRNSRKSAIFAELGKVPP